MPVPPASPYDRAADIFEQPTALAALVARLEPSLRATIRKYRVDADVEDDLLQDTWIRAWERRAQHSAAGVIDGWIIRLCRSLCTTHVRRETAERLRRLAAAPVLAESRTSFGSDAQISSALLNDRLADGVWDAIRALPPRQFVVAVERLALDTPAADVAEQHGMAIGTVYSTLNHARQTLRSSLLQTRNALIEIREAHYSDR